MNILGSPRMSLRRHVLLKKFSALASGLYWTKISAIEAHSVVNRKVTDSNTFELWHDRLKHLGSIMMRRIIENSSGHSLKNLKILSNGEFSCTGVIKASSL